MIHWLSDPTFWTALLQIVAIDILLGGDNAVVIALACRHLPAHRRKQAIFGGVAGAILIRICCCSSPCTCSTCPTSR